mmetsp:Transcript_89265/g.252955  ORF Transcript_89265/g.252955 Transcript_89265/m.252955 type:complete len:231 (-) Transcript_89265:950-1642(-)
MSSWLCSRALRRPLQHCRGGLSGLVPCKTRDELCWRSGAQHRSAGNPGSGGALFRSQGRPRRPSWPSARSLLRHCCTAAKCSLSQSSQPSAHLSMRLWLAVSACRMISATPSRSMLPPSPARHSRGSRRKCRGRWTPRRPPWRGPMWRTRCVTRRWPRPIRGSPPCERLRPRGSGSLQRTRPRCARQLRPWLPRASRRQPRTRVWTKQQARRMSWRGHCATCTSRCVMGP